MPVDPSGTTTTVAVHQADAAELPVVRLAAHTADDVHRAADDHALPGTHPLDALAALLIDLADRRRAGLLTAGKVAGKVMGGRHAR